MNNENKSRMGARLPENYFRRQDAEAVEISRRDALFLFEHPLKFIETFKVFDHREGRYIPLWGMLPEHREDLMLALLLKDAEAEQRLRTPHPNAPTYPPGYWDYSEYE